MACGQGGYPAVLDKGACTSMDAALPDCQKSIKSCYGGDKSACQSAFTSCEGALLDPYSQSGANVYDVRGKQEPATGADKFLNSQKVKDAIGVEVVDAYQECSDSVYSGFEKSGDWMLPIQNYIPDILAKIPVLIYAGDADFICNWLGNRAWTKALEWPGKEEFNKAQEADLKAAGGDAYGKITTAQNFAFAQVFKAGHMVPEDQPEGALDLVNRWVGGEWWKQ